MEPVTIILLAVITVFTVDNVTFNETESDTTGQQPLYKEILEIDTADVLSIHYKGIALNIPDQLRVAVECHHDNTYLVEYVDGTPYAMNVDSTMAWTDIQIRISNTVGVICDEYMRSERHYQHILDTTQYL